MEYENLLRSTEGLLGIVTLNRPERRNALSLDLMLELIRCFDELSSDRNVRAIILAAAGKAFSSGHDLKEMVGRTVNDYRRIFDVCSELMQKIQSIPQPVIARFKASQPPRAASSWQPATWQSQVKRRPSPRPA